MVVVEVDMGASLAQFQEAIGQRLGILPEQQRIIVVGKHLRFASCQIMHDMNPGGL